MCIDIRISDLRGFNGSPLTSKEFSHHVVHELSVNELIVLVIHVFDEFHYFDVMSISRNPSFELQVFILNGFNDTVKHVIEPLFQCVELLLFFPWIPVYHVLYVIPDDSLTFFMNRAALFDVLRPRFTHKSRHLTLRIHTHGIASMPVNAFWLLFHLFNFCKFILKHPYCLYYNHLNQLS